MWGHLTPSEVKTRGHPPFEDPTKDIRASKDPTATAVLGVVILVFRRWRVVGWGATSILSLTVMALQVVLQWSWLSACIVTMGAPVGLFTYSESDRKKQRQTGADVSTEVIIKVPTNSAGNLGLFHLSEEEQKEKHHVNIWQESCQGLRQASLNCVALDHIYHLVNSPSPFLRGRRSFNTGRSSSIQILGVSHHSRQRHKKTYHHMVPSVHYRDHIFNWQQNCLDVISVHIANCRLVVLLVAAVFLSLPFCLYPGLVCCQASTLVVELFCGHSLFAVYHFEDKSSPTEALYSPRRTTVTPQSKMHPIKGPHLRVKIV